MPSTPAARIVLLLSAILTVACTLSLLRSPLVPSGEQHVPIDAAESAAVTPLVVTPSPGAPPQAYTALPSTPGAAPLFCDDELALLLIEDFKRAIETEDGALLASLVSPSHGMDARLVRDGRVVTYDRAHATALFDSTYVVDWGVAAGSGLPITGSFDDLVVPDLMALFSSDYILACKSVLVGGTTYAATWPYPDLDFYSVHNPGSAQYGSLDWQTWVIGMDFAEGKPYLRAIVPFKWEP